MRLWKPVRGRQEHAYLAQVKVGCRVAASLYRHEAAGFCVYKLIRDRCCDGEHGEPDNGEYHYCDRDQHPEYRAQFRALLVGICHGWWWSFVARASNFDGNNHSKRDSLYVLISEDDSSFGRTQPGFRFLTFGRLFTAGLDRSWPSPG